MKRYRLIPETGDIHAIDVPAGKSIVVGREPPANVLFPENRRMSRQHLELWVEDEHIYLRDLNSKNGTYVNGRRIIETVMFPGDTLEIGGYHFILNVLSSPGGADEDRLLDYETFTETKVLNLSGTWAPTADIGKIRAGELAFRLLYQISSELIRAQHPQAFLGRAVARVQRVLNADRVILYLLDPSGELEPVTVAERSGEHDGSAKISRTLLERVCRDKVAVLAMDTASDPRFKRAESIIMAGIRSLVAAPLIADGEVSGVILAESKMSELTFDDFHLQIISAMANLLAFALQRCRLQEKIDRENRIRQRLAQFHSPEVVEAIIRQGGGIAPEKRKATVWFCDIHGFTAFAETHTPEEVEALVNEFFEIAVDVVFRYGGTLDKYLGDGFMAVFGAPLRHDDDAIRAVKAAIELHRRIRRLNGRKEDHYSIQIRSGINTGFLIAGDVGAPVRKDYTVIGDTVNIAMRLQSEVADVDQIVLGPETAELVQKTVSVTALGRVKLRGRSTEMSVFRVCQTDNHPIQLT